jgi:hypothetical protein
VGRAAARSGRGRTTDWLRIALEGGVEAGVAGGTFLLFLRLLTFSELAFLIVWISPSRYSMLARLAKSAVWIALKWPAYPFVGERSLRTGFDAGVVALGLIAHYACTTVWGLLFGLAAFGRSRPATISLGLLWGVFGALCEVSMLSRLLEGALVFNPAVALAFLAYGYVLARTYLRFEGRRTH